MINLVGKTLGKYRVVGKLGSGGMAEVYKAYQPGLDRYVAIKVMHDHLSSDENFVGRFQREALATGKLNHPNIVQALDFDQEGDLYFMVMQFIDGPTLKDEFKARLAQGRDFSLAEIGRMYTALCDGIDYAHSRGMIHRDIKPANMMINTDGQVLLTDFGIARLVEGTQYTATGAMTGTPAYMSPEQGRGLKTIDGRSDIYSMGVILYELATGQVPFEATTPIATVMRHVSDPLPMPRTVKPELPEAVEQVIVKALAKAPDDRYQSAGDLAQALRQAVDLPPGDTLRRNPLLPIVPSPKISGELDPDGVTFTAVNVSSPTLESEEPATVVSSTDPLGQTVVSAPSRPASGVSPVMMGAAVVVLLAVVGGLGLFAMGGTSAETPVAGPSPTATEATATPEAATAQVDAAEVTVTWQAGDDDRDGLTNAEEIEIGTLPDVRDTDQDDIDDWEEINDYQTDPLRSDTDGDGLKDGFEVSRGLEPTSPDTDGDGEPDASDPDPANTPTPTATDTPTATATPTVTPTPPPTNSPTPGPTATATNTATPAPPTATPTPDFSRGRLAFQTNRDINNEIYVMNRDGSGQTNLTNHPGDDRSPVWSPDGERIAFTAWRDDQGVNVMNADGSSQRRLASGGSGIAFDPAWSPDGRRIYFGSSAEGIEYIDLSNDNKRAILTPGKGHNPSVSPDGQRLVYAADDGGNFNLFFISTAGGNASYLTSSPASEIQPVWSPDGQQIAFISAPSTDDEYGELYLVEVGGSGAVLLVPGQNAHPAWSPDGRQLAFTNRSDEGNAEIYVMNADGSNMRNLTFHPADDKHPTWSPR